MMGCLMSTALLACLTGDGECCVLTAVLYLCAHSTNIFRLTMEGHGHL